jgi:TRAP-type C4-dicarboxylate transport system permease small subunit
MKSGKLINFGIPNLCGALLVVIVGLTFLQIVLRQFFDFTFNWSDEIAQFAMTWLALLGSIWANKNDKHLNTGLKLHKKFNEKQILLIDGILALVIAGIAAVVVYQTAIFTSQQWNLESMSLPWLKMGYVFIVLPIAMLTTCYYYLKSFLKILHSYFKKVERI